jgi:DNA-binding transcriptional LysR family regulator
MSVSPPLRKLQYALAVAREAHFRRAAESLNVSQPCLSRQIRELEAEIGTEIFERESHPIEPTAAGREFLAVVAEMLAKIDAEFQRAKDAARNAHHRHNNSLSIGHSAFVPASLRREIRSSLKRKFTYLHLQFRTLSASELVGSIGSMVQIGLTFMPLEIGVLEQIPVRSEPFCAVVSEHSSLIGKPAITIADLKSHPLIVASSERTDPVLYERLLEQCRTAGFRPKIAEEVTSVQEAFDLVEGNVGVAILPQGTCEEAPSTIQFYPITGMDPLQLAFLYRREDFFASELLEELADLSDENKLKCAS